MLSVKYCYEKRNSYPLALFNVTTNIKILSLLKEKIFVQLFKSVLLAQINK